MSFYYLNQNATNVSSPFDNFGTNNDKFNLENFENMPPIDQSKSDSSYQCSDNVQLTGNAIGSSMPNSTLATCKSECKSEGSCIGFDFDNSSSSCTLRNTITDLTSSKQNNVMCVKKTSSACKLNPYVDPAVEAENVISEQEAPPTIPGIITPPPGGTTVVVPPTKPIPKPIAPTKSEQCKPDTIYVDLPCFLDKMDILKNHSDNLMIDLQLLITNLKSCAYIRKLTKKTPPSNNPFKPINDDFNFEISSNVPVIMPTQETIKVYNSLASVLYTNNPANNANVMLGITEPFENSEQTTEFYNTFSFKLIVLVLIVVILMNLK